MQTERKVILIILMLLGIIAVGVTGYMLLLHIGFVDALYMTVIMISTVGFGEIGIMTGASKLFSIVVIFAGLSVVGYSFTTLVSFFFEGNIKDAWRKKRMSDKVSQLRDHYIICGAGDVGNTVIQNFKDKNVKFVVIENNEKRHEELCSENILTVLGNATHEETLHKAGIDYAKGVVSALSSDTDNVFTVLTARGLNDSIYIVARAVERTAHSKLMKAGANKTISPNEIGGQRMAVSMIRPSVTSFLDVMTKAGDVLLDLEEVNICEQSKVAGMSLSEARIPEQTGLIVLALKKKGANDFRINPRASEIMDIGDSVIVLGTSDQVDKLNDMVKA